MEQVVVNEMQKGGAFRISCRIAPPALFPVRNQGFTYFESKFPITSCLSSSSLNS
jgi:hypothetical protein